MRSKQPPNLGDMEATKRGERDEDKTSMFYSQCLLSKKGALAAIWVAACCFKRLKKRQVIDTHIPSSVDTILREGLPAVTYRILAYLLIGVVRIYSRKVEYLFQSCHETVCDINKFSVGKKVVPFKNIIRSSYSIILPERYELDSFQLDVADVADGGDIAQNEDIQDARRDTFIQCSSGTYPYEQFTLHREENGNTQISAGVTLQPETFSYAQTPHKLSTNWEASTAVCTPPDKVLSPHQLEVEMELSSLDHMKTSQTSQERFHGLRFSREECMDIDMICEADVELLNLLNDYQLQNADEGDGDALEKALAEKLYHVLPEEKEVPHVLPKEKEMPSVAEKTPDSEVLDARDAPLQELLVVPTPAKKENIQRPRKRKCIIDVSTVLDNQVMKEAIKDASDLVCKRRKAPHTVIDIWRFHCIPALSKNFSDPLIPCVALELQHTDCGKKEKGTEPSLRVAAPIRIAELTEVPGDKRQDVVAPRTPTNSRSTIAPGTPVLCPVSARVFASSRGGDSDWEGPLHSYENVRKESSMLEEEDSGPNLMDEADADEGDSQEHTKKNGLSARARTVARYLHQVIHKKKQEGKESVPLLPILERKTRAQNARFFFEILVLSTRGLVNVRQERAYDNVFVQETPKMEATFASC